MKISIRNFWNAEMQVSISTVHVDPEDVLKSIGFITICDIIIDAQIIGEVRWDGKKLSIHESGKFF